MTSKQLPPNPFLNREMSWLEFNSRILDEAQDPKNPLLERLRFLNIFHSNLDEFFMVRVAALRRRLSEGDSEADAAGLDPNKLLDLILSRVRELEQKSYDLYSEKIVPALAKEKIHILASEELKSDQQTYLDEYFDREIYPVLTPVAIDESQAFPRLLNLSFNFAVLLTAGEEESELRLAVVQVPGLITGLCRLPQADEVHVCWLSGVIHRRLTRLFSGYRIVEASGFRITRDAEMDFDDEGGAGYVRKLESELRRRQVGKTVRIEFEQQMTPKLQELLQERLEVDQSAMLPLKGLLDKRPLQFLVDMPGFDHLRYPPQPPLMPPVFLQETQIFDIIREGDILLHHPYDSFDPVAEFVQAASQDPDVLAIKQTLYRTSGAGSPILNSLMKAAENGKQVTVLVELTARFDEERNIGWARKLEEAGAHVLYGLAHLKTHAKITLVVRREQAGIRRYLHLGTGNYNERTARIYTDFGLLTASDEFGSDASGFFNAITGYSEPPEFKRLVMAPFGLREKIVALLRREADRARTGQVCGIMAKINSLTDPLIIQELCAASSAGVSIQLNVRGICCLRPGVPNLTENVKVISIVDRYLEHSRALVCRNGGDTEVYLSSGDWMPRNLDRRVELMFPVLDEAPRRKVIEALEAQFADNQKARLLLPDGTYRKVSAGRSEPVRVQELLYRKLLEQRERAISVSPLRLVPLEASEG